MNQPRPSSDVDVQAQPALAMAERDRPSHRHVLVIALWTTAAVSVLFDFTAVDLGVQSWISSESQGAWRGVWRFLYLYGTWPGLALGLGALVPLVASWWWRKLAPFRRSSLFILSSFLIGPGLLVNLLLKSHFGRPRPRDVQAASDWFHPQFIPGWDPHFTSFTCGHASVGFFTCCLYFVFRDARPRTALACLLLSFIYGSIMGLARIAVGAHYPSDVAWSALLTFYVAWMLDRWVFQKRRSGSIGATDGATETLPLMRGTPS